MNIIYGLICFKLKTSSLFILLIIPLVKTLLCFVSYYMYIYLLISSSSVNLVALYGVNISSLKNRLTKRW